MRILPVLVSMALAGGVMAEDFESLPVGPFEVLAPQFGAWRAAEGHAEIHDAHARSGKQSLRLLGGGRHAVELHLKQKTGTNVELAFWAERWTSRSPFSFRIEARREGKWSQVFDG